MGENDSCVEKAEERLEACVDAASTRVSRSTISMDEATFSECIRAHLGQGKPHHAGPPHP